MNENLNLVEILKDAPKGTKLWSPICGECELVEVDENLTFPIKCRPLDCDGCCWKFRSDGSFAIYKDAECLLFPSKENRDWSTFQVANQHKHFEPFQKVLCAFDHDYGYKVWAAGFYSHYDESTRKHYLASSFVVDDEELIPYEGNEHKLGKLVK